MIARLRRLRHVRLVPPSSRSSRSGASGRDAGMTLVELLVAASVSTVLLAGVGTVFIGSLRSLNTVNSKAELATSSDIAMRAITERLRAADYRPPQTEITNTAIQAASLSSVSFNAYVQDTALASSLATSINALNPGDTNASWMSATGLVPKLIQISYAASSSACGGRPGVIQTTTPPRFYLSGAQIFAWDTGAASQCLMRTTTAPSVSRPMFRYFTGCGLSDPESSASLSAIEGIQVQLYASDATTTTPLVLQNRVCLVNVVGGTP